MPSTAVELYPVSKVRGELRLPSSGTVNSILQGHIGAAVSYIQKLTGYPLVDDEVRHNMMVARLPFYVKGRFLDQVEEMLTFDKDGRPVDYSPNGNFVSLRKIGKDEYLVDSTLRALNNERVLVRISRRMASEDVPAAFYSAMVMWVRDAFDGIPRQATERAVKSVLIPWAW